MSHLHRIWADIRRGENIEIYLTIVVALALSIFGILGISTGAWTAPLTLLVLALLAYAMLQNRHQIETLQQSLMVTTSDVLLRRWPGDRQKQDIANAKRILIVGVSLSQTIRSNYALFEEKLRRGDIVHVLVVKPDGATAEITARRIYGDNDKSRTNANIHATIRSMAKLQQTTSGNVEVRVLDYPASIGGFAVDMETPKGAIYLKITTYNMPNYDIPRLVIDPSNTFWYEFFGQQFRVLWEAGEKIDLASYKTT